MANPLRKYLSKEDIFHEACVTWLQLQHKKMLWMHVPNEGERSAFERLKFKVLGGQAGISDIIILDTSGDTISKGLAVELKFGEGKCSESQVDFLIKSHKKGFAAAVVYDDLDYFIKLVTDYMEGTRSFGKILLYRHKKVVELDYTEAKKELIKKRKDLSTKEKNNLFQRSEQPSIKPISSPKLFAGQ